MYDAQLLLWKNFKGELAPSEAEWLTDWLAQSPENQRLAAEVRQLWFRTGEQANAFADLNLDAEFARLKTRIRAEQQPLRVTHFAPRQWLRAAAAVAVLVAAVWAIRANFFQNQSAAPIEVFAEAGQTKTIELPDGSRVFLRSGGHLIFPKTFPKNERPVRLDGEAFFEVAHNPAQPFSVALADGSAVQVLGTQFNVRANAGAATTEVFVKSGKVRFENTANHVVLVANQRGVLTHADGKIEAEQVAGQANDLAWQTGGLSFVNTPVGQVLADFEKYYGVKIRLENEAIRGCLYTAPLVNQPVAEAVAALARTFNCTVEMVSAKEFLLKNGRCR